MELSLADHVTRQQNIETAATMAYHFLAVIRGSAVIRKALFDALHDPTIGIPVEPQLLNPGEPEMRLAIFRTGWQQDENCSSPAYNYGRYVRWSLQHAYDLVVSQNATKAAMDEELLAAGWRMHAGDRWSNPHCVNADRGSTYFTLDAYLKMKADMESWRALGS